MTWPTVTPDDVVKAWRPLISEEEAVASTRITVVGAELNRTLRLHGITGTPTIGSPGYDSLAEVEEWEVLYTSVIAGVVQRSLINPEGWSEVREELDDWAETRRRDKSLSSGEWYLDDADVAKLLPKLRRQRGAFSIHLGQT